MKYLFLSIMICLVLFSCNSGKEPEKSNTTATSEKTLFEEVKERTIKNPKDAEAWYHLADLYGRSEMYLEEADALTKYIALEPGHGYVYNRLGIAYNRLGEYHKAIKNFQLAIKYAPKNALLYNNIAVSYGKIGKTSEEITALKRAIAIRPRYATARYNLGVVYLKQGKQDLAVKQYRELSKFDQGVADALKKEIDAKRKRS